MQCLFVSAKQPEDNTDLPGCLAPKFHHCFPSTPRYTHTHTYTTTHPSSHFVIIESVIVCLRSRKPHYKNCVSAVLFPSRGSSTHHLMVTRLLDENILLFTWPCVHGYYLESWELYLLGGISFSISSSQSYIGLVGNLESGKTFFFFLSASHHCSQPLFERRVSVYCIVYKGKSLKVLRNHQSKVLLQPQVGMIGQTPSHQRHLVSLHRKKATLFTLHQASHSNKNLLTFSVTSQQF